MQLVPRYGTDPVLVLDDDPSAIAAPAIRQRRRLADTLASFTDEQWAHPSRCELWSVRDVIVHLESTNTFWTFSISAGMSGKPTQFLATFDPAASPAQLVAAAGDISNAEVLDRFAASTNALADLWASMDASQWTTLAEAPPGHISASAVTHHALWDSWVHERDVLLPLGLDSELHDDEVTSCLRYAAGLGPALARCRGDAHTGVFTLAATDPDLSIMVDVGDTVAVRSGRADADLHLAGNAVDLLESLSVRRPLSQTIPPTSAWMLTGLSDTFDPGR
jgi:uncharacterized protein (TIGR03083 family)